MALDVSGCWRLIVWRRIEQETEPTFPLGEKPTGLLIYTSDGHMGVQMLSADRKALDTADALSGTEAERAAAYSGCLAYFGRYTVEGDSVTHMVDGSLFPNWSGTIQVRPGEISGDQLTLSTPPQEGPTGTIVNEIVWVRV